MEPSGWAHRSNRSDTAHLIAVASGGALMPKIVRGRPRIVMPRPIAMHAPCDQLRRVLQLYSFPEITRNAEYERLPGPHLQHRGRHRYPFCCSGSLRMISSGREVLPHSYLADTGPD